MNTNGAQAGDAGSVASLDGQMDGRCVLVVLQFRSECNDFFRIMAGWLIASEDARRMLWFSVG